MVYCCRVASAGLRFRCWAGHGRRRRCITERERESESRRWWETPEVACLAVFLPMYLPQLEKRDHLWPLFSSSHRMVAPARHDRAVKAEEVHLACE